MLCTDDLMNTLRHVSNMLSMFILLKLL